MRHSSSSPSPLCTSTPANYNPLTSIHIIHSASHSSTPSTSNTISMCISGKILCFIYFFCCHPKGMLSLIKLRHVLMDILFNEIWNRHIRPQIVFNSIMYIPSHLFFLLMLLNHLLLLLRKNNLFLLRNKLLLLLNNNLF